MCHPPDNEDEEPIYKLRFHTYSGMQIPVDTGELTEIRERAASYIRSKRSQNYEVVTIERGIQWEIQTPSNLEGFVVTDDDGVLMIHA